MTLNFGDEKVTKLYYGSKDVSGTPMLEKGTRILQSDIGDKMHLLSVTDDWSNITNISINGISSTLTRSGDIQIIRFASTTCSIEDLNTPLTFGITHKVTAVKKIVDGKNVLSATSDTDVKMIEVYVA